MWPIPQADLIQQHLASGDVKTRGKRSRKRMRLVQGQIGMLPLPGSVGGERL